MLAYRNRLSNELSHLTSKYISKNIPRADTYEYQQYQTARALHNKSNVPITCENMFDGLPLIRWAGIFDNRSDYVGKNLPTLCQYGASKRYKRRKNRNKLKHAERMVRKLALSHWQQRLYDSQASWRNELQEQEIMNIIESQEHIPRLSIRTSPRRKKNLRRRSRELNSPDEVRFWVSSDSSSDEEILESREQELTSMKKIYNKVPFGPWTRIGHYLNKDDDELEYLALESEGDLIIRNKQRKQRRLEHKKQLFRAKLKYICNERADMSYFMMKYDIVMSELLYNVNDFMFEMDDFSNYDNALPQHIKDMFEPGELNLSPHSKDDIIMEKTIDLTVIGNPNLIQSAVPFGALSVDSLHETFINEQGKRVCIKYEYTRLQKFMRPLQDIGPMGGVILVPQDDDAGNSEERNYFTTYVLTAFKDMIQQHIDAKTSGAASMELFIEGFADTLWLMYKQQNIFDSLHVLKLYICLRYNISIGKMIIDFVKDLFSGFTVQDDEGNATGDFSFKSLFNDWKGFYHGEFLAKIIKAIACLVSLGLCKIIKLPFNLDSFQKNFCDKGLDNKSWPDLLTCVVDVAIYVFENGYKWFTGKMSFLDVIRSPSMSRKYDEDFSLIINNINLYEQNELHRINMDRYQYESLMDEVNNLTKSFYDKATASTEKNLMRMNLRKLGQVANKMILVNSSFTMRKAPFSYYLYGKSSVGKSTLIDIINNALLRANDLPFETKYQVSINASDSYQSEVQPWHIVIGCDDIANIKAEHEEGNSMKLVLDYVGNTAVHALKADVDSKGKVLLKPMIFHATTNVKDVESSVKSNEPLAILRRLGICITVVVRPEFTKDRTHMLDPSKMNNAINDAWYFTVEEARPNLHDDTSTSQRTSIKWVPCNHNGIVLHQVGLKTLLDFLIYRSKIHFVQQASLIASIESIQSTSLCDHGTYATLCDQCQSINATLLETQDDDSIPYRLLELSKLPVIWHYIYDFLPYYVLDRPGLTKWLRWLLEDDDIQGIKKTLNITAISLFAQLIYIGLVGGIVGVFVFLVTLVIYIFCIYCLLLMMHSEYARMRNNVMSAIEPIAANKYKILAGVGATVGIVAILRSFRKITPLISMQLEAHGSNYSTPKPDNDYKPNPWLKPHVEKPIVDHTVETTTRDQMINVVSDSLGYATYEDADNYSTSADIFPYKGNVWICNHHTISKRDWTKVTVKRRESDISINRTVPIHTSMWKRIPNTDLALITLSGLGDVRDFSSFFPEDIDKYVAEPVTWIFKDENRHIVKTEFLAERRHIVFTDQVTLKKYDYQGYYYDMPIEPKHGHCMAPLICRGKYPLILGFHSSGDTSKKIGCANTVSQKQLSDTYRALFNRCDNLDHINVQTHSSNTMKLDFPDYNIKNLNHIHDKSPFNYMNEAACVALYGAHTGNRRRFKSKVEPSIISDSVTKICGVPRDVGPPKNISNWKPWHADAVKVTATRYLDIEPLIRANLDFRNHIFGFLHKNEHYKDTISPLSRVAALSGVDGCRGIDGIKLATSAGFPRCKPKKHYVFESDEEHEFITRPLDLKQEDWNEIQRLEDVLANGKRVYFIHRINLKDEPTKLDKEKVRTFAGCTLECLIMIRTYFLPIAKLIMENSELFECAVGVNAHGPEWTVLTNHMQKYGESRTIAGDYKNYDSEMWCHMVLMAFQLMIDMAEWFGYSERQIIIMQGLATELAYGLTEYNGEYAMFLAQMLSGHAMTVFVNSFCNSLYMRFAYYAIHLYVWVIHETYINYLKTFLLNNEIDSQKFMDEYMHFDRWQLDEPDILPFASNVALMCYGDDNKMSVSSRVPWFNHCSIAAVLGLYGITYTMADKTSNSKPYIHASECSFLKRYAVWDAGYNQYLAPLEMGSIWKTLHANVVSDAISREQQSAESVLCVMREMFHHGEMKYCTMMLQLQKVIEECNLTCYFKKGLLPTYEEQEKEYITKYLCIPDNKNECASEPSAEIAKNGVMMMDTSIDDICDGKSPILGLSCHGNDSYLGMDSPVQRPHSYLVHNLTTDSEISEIATNNKSNNSSATATNNASSMMGVEKHQNTVFRDGSEQWMAGIPGAYDDTRKVAIHDDVDLGEFFSRPIRVPIPEWVPGSATPYGVTFNPWSTFLQNPRVANRLSNYKLMQFTMKVKIVINGNPFYYGRLMMDYQPLHAYNTIDPVNTLEKANVVLASQRSHLYIDPTSSQAGELALPFIWPQNSLNLLSDDRTRLGQIHIREVNQLKHANASTTPISLQAYIWAENVRLSVPTTRNIDGLTAQDKDEYGSKPISNTATTISKIMGSMTNIPIIGPYAKSTSMVASAIGNAAKLFGYSRPNDISDPVQTKPRTISRMANTDCGDMTTKLSVDSKQELSIDPKIVGVDTGDDMVISKIAGIETYINSFAWPITGASGDLLYNIRVSPMHGVVCPSTVSTSYLIAACSYASIPFKYWRGTMRYRFQIVCSEYHRGRLRFVYDPSYIVSGENNIAYTKIVDIANERDFVMDVSWGQQTTFLPVGKLGAQVPLNMSTTPFITESLECNGVIGVYVLNDLTSPNSVTNNDIQINVSVSMCDDVEFAAPTEVLASYNLQPQDAEGDIPDNTNRPTIDESTDQIMVCDNLDRSSDVYFGEVITSFRTLLKRYCFHTSYMRPLTTNNTMWGLRMTDFPFYRGLTPTGRNLANPTTPTNYVKTTLLNYLAPAFLAYRGGVRWKYVVDTNDASGIGTVVIERNDTKYQTPPDIFNALSAITLTNPDSFARDNITYQPGSLGGVELTTVSQQPVTEVELPYYDNARFSTCKDLYNNTYNAVRDRYMVFNKTHTLRSATYRTKLFVVDAYCAGAEDSTFVLFQGCPPISTGGLE